LTTHQRSRWAFSEIQAVGSTHLPAYTVATKVLANASSPTQDYAVAPPSGELFCETNDNSVAILLSYGTARVLLAGVADVREEYVAGDPYTGSLIVINVPKLHTV
jgi:hypothetical protein